MNDKPDDLTLMHLFYQCSHRLHAGGACRGQGRLLTLLLERGPLSQRELTDITGLRSATLSEQLDILERNGFITRTRNEQDRRNVDIALNDAGYDAARRAAAAREERAHRLFGSLTEAQKEQLFALLCLLLSSWEDTAHKQEDSGQ